MISTTICRWSGTRSRILRFQICDGQKNANNNCHPNKHPGMRKKLRNLDDEIFDGHNYADHNNADNNCHLRDEEEAEEGRTKVLAARQREREETRAQVSLSSR